jgi:hypothetical protein
VEKSISRKCAVAIKMVRQLATWSDEEDRPYQTCMDCRTDFSSSVSLKGKRFCKHFALKGLSVKKILNTLFCMVRKLRSFT